MVLWWWLGWFWFSWTVLVILVVVLVVLGMVLVALGVVLDFWCCWGWFLGMVLGVPRVAT